jgi:hypothetical protein
MAQPTTRDQFREWCLDNKYTKWYFNIIQNAIERDWDKNTVNVYVERHHYIPKSLGGDDNQTVFLTSREHFITHILLTKMFTGTKKSKMVWAVMCMKGKDNRYYNSRLYESVKKELKHSEESKEKMSKTRTENKTFAGKNNPMWGKRGKLSPHFGKKQSFEHKESRLNSIRGRKQSDEAKAKMSKNRPKGPSGKRWFNNGIYETFDLPENKPKEFVFGRLKRKA